MKMFPSCIPCLQKKKKRSRRKPRNLLSRETMLVLILFVPSGPDFVCEDFECEPTEWFISLTLLFYCISKHPAKYFWGKQRVHLVSRGWWCRLKHPPSESEKFLCKVPFNPKKSTRILHSLPWCPHICCNSNNHLYSPTESIKLQRFHLEDTKEILHSVICPAVH